MKKIVFSILSLVVLNIQTYAQNLKIQEQVAAVSPDSFVNEALFSIKQITANKTAVLGEYVSKFSLLEADDFILNKIVAEKPTALEVDVTFNGEIITLQLIPSNVVNERSTFFARNSSGKTPINYKQGAYYYGVIKNQPNSLVAISFFANDIIGIIANDKGNYVLGKSNTSNYDSNEYILYNDKDLLIENDTACFTDDEVPDVIVIPQQQQRMMNNCDGVLEIGVYIETDHEMYVSRGNDENNVLNYVTALFSVTATLFQNESITTFVSEVNIWTEEDPYFNAMDTTEALNLFEIEMSGGFNGDLAHLFSGRDLGGGRANIGVLCDSNNQRTAVSGGLAGFIFGFPNYSWSVFVVTHEIGHNIGSQHTHACVWNGNNTAIDGCGPAAGFPTEGGCPDPGLPAGGTIMSYCHSTGVNIDFNLGFGPQPGDVIRDHVNNATCLLTACCETDVIITGNNYNIPVMQSDTWIVSSGQTTIENTANVRLDANPLSGYIEFDPVANNDFFLAEPVGDGVFVAEALDGCDVAIPARMGSPDDIFADNDIKNTKDDTSPEGFLLEQNIPNPFSEKTTIKASIPNEVMNAKIVIYNLQGIRLESYSLNERGKVAIEISGGKLAAGVYLYTLMADGRKIDTKKMILTR